MPREFPPLVLCPLLLDQPTHLLNTIFHLTDLMVPCALEARATKANVCRAALDFAATIKTSLFPMDTPVAQINCFYLFICFHHFNSLSSLLPFFPFPILFTEHVFFLCFDIFTTVFFF